MQKQKSINVNRDFHKKNLDFFDTFQNKQDQQFIQEYKSIQRPQYFSNSLNKFDYVRRKIYELKFDEKYQKRLIYRTRTEPILKQQYLNLVNDQLMDPLKLKGVYQILKQSILTPFLEELIDIANKTTSDVFFLFQMHNLINTVAKVLKNYQPKKKLKDINNDLLDKIKIAQSKIVIIQDQVNYERQLIKMRRLFIQSFEDNNQQKYLQIINSWIKTYQEVKQKIQLSFYSTPIIQKIMSFIKQKLKLLDLNNKQQSQQFNKFIKFHQILMQSKYQEVNWFKFKQKKIVTDYLPISDSTSKHQQKKFCNQFNCRIILRNFLEIQSNINKFQINFRKVSQLRNEGIAAINNNIKDMYNNQKNSCLDYLHNLYNQLFQIQDNQFVQQNIKFNFRKLRLFFQNFTKQQQDKSQFISNKFTHIKCFINTQNSTLDQYKIQYILNGLKSSKYFQDKIPFLVLCAICIQQFYKKDVYFNQYNTRFGRNGKQTTDKNNLTKKEGVQNNKIIDALKFFNQTLFKNEHQILECFQYGCFVQGWNLFQSYKKNNSISQKLKPFQEIENQYNKLKNLQQEYFNLNNPQSLKQMFMNLKCKDQLKTILVGTKDLKNKQQSVKKDKICQIKFFEMIKILSVIIKDNLHLHEQGWSINQEEFANQLIKHYVKCQQYIKQNQNFKRYIITLEKHPIYGTCDQNQMKNLEEKFSKTPMFANKYRKIDVKLIDKSRKIIIILKKMNMGNGNWMQTDKDLKQCIRMLFFSYKMQIQNKTLKNIFPYWYMYLDENTLKIEKIANRNSFMFKINSIEAFLISVLQSSQFLQQKLGQYSNFPFINLINIIKKQEKQDWFQFNKFQKEEFHHLLKQMKIFAIEHNNQNPCWKDFPNFPYFWCHQRKIVQILTFHSRYKYQTDCQKIRLQKKKQRNCFTLAYQGLYSIEGLFENSVISQMKSQQQQKQFKALNRFQWTTCNINNIKQKQDFKDMIMQAAMFLKQYWPKQEYERQKLFKQFASPNFKTFLRIIRNICAHYTQNLKQGKIQRTFQNKITAIQKSFPRFFIFLYQWKNINGKPFSWNQYLKKPFSFNKFNLKQVNSNNYDIKSWITNEISNVFKQQESHQKVINQLKKIPQLINYTKCNLKKIFQIYTTNQIQKSQTKDIYCSLCVFFLSIQNKLNERLKQFKPTEQQHFFWQILCKLFKQQILFQQHGQSQGNPKVKSQICFWMRKKSTLYTFFYIERLKDQRVNIFQNAREKQNKIYEEFNKKNDKKLIQQLNQSSNSINKMFLFQFLSLFPQLLFDLRYTRCEWDQTIRNKKKLLKI